MGQIENASERGERENRVKFAGPLSYFQLLQNFLSTNFNSKDVVFGVCIVNLRKHLKSGCCPTYLIVAFELEGTPITNL